MMYLRIIRAMLRKKSFEIKAEILFLRLKSNVDELVKWF